MEPCKQEGNIGELKGTVEGIEKALDRLAEGQEKFITVLEKIAAQGSDIESLKKGSNELFRRVRDVEIKQEGERVKVGGIVAGVSVGVSAATAFLVKYFGGD